MTTKRRVVVENDETSSDEVESSENEIEENPPEPQSAIEVESDAENWESENDDEHESDSSEGDNEEVENENINAAWADSIKKILSSNKSKKKKTLVLSKAKKLTDARKAKQKPVGFQVENADGEVKEEEIEVENDVEDKNDEGPLRKKKRDILSVRVKPNILERDRERTLMKIATKGVVQLFNAVKTQQKDIKAKLQEAGPLEVRKDKVMKNIDKRAFLDVLMGEKSETVEDVTGDPVRNGGANWNVLRDDFMMGAKMKDWDKELEEEDVMEVENVVESE